jgi:hypothetical protein
MLTTHNKTTKTSQPNRRRVKMAVPSVPLHSYIQGDIYVYIYMLWIWVQHLLLLFSPKPNRRHIKKQLFFPNIVVWIFLYAMYMAESMQIHVMEMSTLHSYSSRRHVTVDILQARFHFTCSAMKMYICKCYVYISIYVNTFYAYDYIMFYSSRRDHPKWCATCQASS